MAHADEQVRLVAVSTFRSTADAHVAKGVLDELGIESVIRSDNAGGMYPALAGADLLVRAEDAEKAVEALKLTASRDSRRIE
jgi:putative signal transducing protein